MKEKPIKVRPMFYSVILEPLKRIAVEFGYNLVVHGSMDRDMDLILIPWVDNCSHSDNVIKAFTELLGGDILKQRVNGEDSLSKPMYEGAGRVSYLINLNREGIFNQYLDKEYYLDISVTPKIIKNI